MLLELITTEDRLLLVCTELERLELLTPGALELDACKELACDELACDELAGDGSLALLSDELGITIAAELALAFVSDENWLLGVTRLELLAVIVLDGITPVLLRAAALDACMLVSALLAWWLDTTGADEITAIAELDVVGLLLPPPQAVISAAKLHSARIFTIGIPRLSIRCSSYCCAGLVLLCKPGFW